MTSHAARTASVLDATLLHRALLDALRKLNPASLIGNPVIFVTEVVAALATAIALRDAVTGHAFAFTGQIAGWLWFTVIFAKSPRLLQKGAAAPKRTRFAAPEPRPSTRSWSIRSAG